MDKIIGTINNNLRSVIEGIRQHLSDSEGLFEKIKADMDKKVNQAADYKEQVTKAKDKINQIEDEIEKLEKDLNDLNDKFGGTDFKEILQAGNKEINTKIIEKRAVIQKESQRILDLTDKARKIKDDLIDLREKKYALSQDIKETKVVEKFYSAKVNEIIDFVEAGNDIELAVDNSPESDLLADNERENELVEVSTVFNDHIFEEIDEITTSEPDASLVEEELKKVVNVTFIPREEKKDEVFQKQVEDAMGEKVEDKKEEAPIVEEKKEVVQEPISFDNKEVLENTKEENETEEIIPEKEKSEEIIPDEPNVEEVQIEEETPAEEEKKEETPVVEEKKEETTKETKEEKEDTLSEEPTVDELLKSSESLIEENEKDIPSTLDELINKTINSSNFDDSSIDLNMLDDDVEDEGNEEVKNTELLPGEESIINPMYEEETDPSIIELEIEDDNERDKNLFQVKENVKGEDLLSLGIEPSKLKPEDLDYLMSKIDYARINKRIAILKKHNLGISCTYPNIRVLTDLSSENLDAMLTMLENVTKDDLSPIVSVLDKVNMNKLEQSIEINKGKDIVDIVVPAVEEIDDNIKIALDMTDEEYEEMKKNISEETLKKMNIFTDRVVKNYYVLKDLKIDNIREVLIKYPSKLLLDNKEFRETLDKYDLDDLVRCINKNAKVFDKI